ncbi:Terpene cyclase ascF [Cladobotryum mycophilum]|uniref:Terpene cyclase ascF n=1 Tax=Cladobotryum mycophilum TaxID=491253 RepID=A0ABR0SID6_9HYPO
MGFSDVPPPHVSPWFGPVYDATFHFAGAAWTLCYILIAREGLRTKSYGMPLFALANNFAWEMVWALYVADSPLEKTAMTIWMVIDIPIIYSTLRYGAYEWAHAPAVKRNLGKIFVFLVVMCGAAHFGFASWWIRNGIAEKPGKFYRGVEGPDITEMSFWAVSTCQVVVSVTSLAQLITRQHSGGTSWAIWASRFFGTLVGLNINYGWAWYTWTEAHEYFVSSPGIFMWSITTICDILYAIILLNVKRSEKVLADGRKVAGDQSKKGL